MSRRDSELDYLPTQYISDLAKFMGFDGICYSSTFDKEAYNLALFDQTACNCVSCKNYFVDSLTYKLKLVKWFAIIELFLLIEVSGQK